MKAVKKILFMMLTGILAFIFVTTIYENIVRVSKLNEFLDNQILLEESSTSYTRYYYKTNKDYYSKNYTYPGSFCDILVTTDSSIEVPILYNILSYTVGGHAGLVGLNYNDKYYSIKESDTIDTTDNDRSDETTIYPAYFWDDSYKFPNYYILRVDLTTDEAIEVFNEVVSCLGDPYNMTFLLNTRDSSYCSDLISKAFQRVNINLNYDFGATTVIDLIASKYTTIVGYKKYENGVSYYYTY